MIECFDLIREHAELRYELTEAAQQVMETGAFILGQPVLEVENAFADLCGTTHAVAVNSGTDALELVLQALGVGEGDEVITVSNSFVASVASIVNVGARPVLVDVGPDEQICVEAVAATVNERTSAVIAVHLRGLPAPVEQLAELCADAGILLVEDCAQAVGACIGDRPVGSFGVAGCFSLHPQKNVGAMGDGGMVVTSREALARRVCLMRNHGLLDRDTVDSFGRNSRLDALQAAFVSVKLRHHEQWLRRRRSIAAYLLDELRETHLTLPGAPAGRTHSYYSFVVRTPQRNDLRQHLRDAGIAALIHYPTPVHQQPAWLRRFPAVHLPATELQAAQILTLPCHEWLSDSAVESISENIRRWARARPTQEGGAAC